MRRINLRILFFFMLLMCCGAGTASAEGDTPWKVRRPADNTVLPSEYVHRPGADSMAEPDQAEEPLSGHSQAQRPDASPADQKPQPEPEPEPKAAVSTPETSRPAPAKPAKKLNRAGPLNAVMLEGDVLLTLPLDQAKPRTRHFWLKKPGRLVVDVLGSWDNTGGNVFRLDSPWVDKVVLGEHDEFLRMVIYASPDSGAVGLTPDISNTDDGLRIVVTPIR